MFLAIIILLSLASTIGLTLLCSLDWWFAPLIFIGSLLVIILLFLLIVWIMTLCFPKRDDYKPKKFLGAIIKSVCRALVTFFRIKPTVENFELLNQKRPMLIVSNHQSLLDPVIKLTKMDDLTVTAIMKEEIMKIPVVGRYLKVAGYYPLNRGNDREALKVIRKSIDRIVDNKSLIVYPEGTRSKTLDIGEYKDGTFRIAQKAKCPICVVAVDNDYKIKKNWPFKKTKTLLKVCKVIEYSEIENLKTNEIREMVEQITKQGLEEARLQYKWLK